MIHCVLCPTQLACLEKNSCIGEQDQSYALGRPSPKPTPLPPPSTCHTVDEALGAAKNMGLSNILILSETPEGFLMLNAGSGEALTAAQCAWLILLAGKALTNPETFKR